MDLRRLPVFRLNSGSYGVWPKSRGGDKPKILTTAKQHPALSNREHRPWPLPDRRWLLRQTWLNLAFLHWEIDYQDLRKRIPSALDIDLYEGKAWIAIVPFDMHGVTLRHCPTFDPISNFPEINVRTYVTCNGRPGVWFFSLDVPSKLAVWAARTFFNLPYRHGYVKIQDEGDAFQYSSEVSDDRFQARYQPHHHEKFGKRSFEIWATERYCLYCQGSKGQLYRTEVHHRQWPLQAASVDILDNTLLSDFEIGKMHPSVLYSESIDVVAYWPERIG